MWGVLELRGHKPGGSWAREERAEQTLAADLMAKRHVLLNGRTWQRSCSREGRWCCCAQQHPVSDPSASTPEPPGAEPKHLKTVAEQLASSPVSEWKSSISAGTILPQVFPQHRKQDGRTSYICVLAIKQPLKDRQDGAEAPHLLHWNPWPPAVFTCLCAVERQAGGRWWRSH